MFPISTNSLIIKVNEIKCVTQTTAPTAPTALMTPTGDSGIDIAIFLEDCIDCAPAIYGDANLETDFALTPLGPGQDFTFGDLSAELGIMTEPVVTTAAPTVPTAAPTVPTAAPADPIMIEIIEKDQFRGRSVLALFREITIFDEAACATTTPTTSSVVESEVFRGESSVGTLLEDIKKFDETACRAPTTATGVNPTTTGAPAPPTTTVPTEVEKYEVGRVTDEMINEFIVNKRCV